MNLILHPEILLKRRGGIGKTGYYRRMMEILETSGHEINGDRTVGFKIAELDRTDPVDAAIEYASICLEKDATGDSLKKFLFSFELLKICYNSPVYKMGKEFFSVLKHVELSINPDMMPENESGFIAFPDSGLFLGTKPVYGAYFTIEKDAEGKLLRFLLIGHDEGKTDPNVLKLMDETGGDIESICSQAINEHFCLYNNSSHIAVPLEMGTTVEDQVLRLTRECDHSGCDCGDNFPSVARALFNSVLYVFSQKPDLQKSKTDHGMSKSQRVGLERKGEVFSEHSIPITLVSWNYKKPMVYNKDGCLVPAHVQGYWCGEGRTRLEIRLKSPFKRTFKNVRDQDDSSSGSNDGEESDRKRRQDPVENTGGAVSVS